VAHPLVVDWALRPDAVSPRRLELLLDAAQYPDTVETVRLNVRWFVGGEYTVHYLESRGEDRWQYRWDRHPKPATPVAHFHSPPDVDGVEPSPIETANHLGVLFAVLEWVTERVETLHAT
jgi:hypothetical protein